MLKSASGKVRSGIDSIHNEGQNKKKIEKINIYSRNIHSHESHQRIKSISNVNIHTLLKSFLIMQKMFYTHSSSPRNDWCGGTHTVTGSHNVWGRLYIFTSAAAAKRVNICFAYRYIFAPLSARWRQFRSEGKGCVCPNERGNCKTHRTNAPHWHHFANT